MFFYFSMVIIGQVTLKSPINVSFGVRQFYCYIKDTQDGLIKAQFVGPNTELHTDIKVLYCKGMNCSYQKYNIVSLSLGW